jgi:F-actin capping protein beta subunit
VLDRQGAETGALQAPNTRDTLNVFFCSFLTMGDEGDLLDHALDLMRRMPPSNVEENLAGLLDLIPEETDGLLGSIDQPLKTAVDADTGKEYLLCEYNRDGDSYRFVVRYISVLRWACDS